jgi:hypothetical protein
MKQCAECEDMVYKDFSTKSTPKNCIFYEDCKIAYLEKKLDVLVELAEAYESADENDYCTEGEYTGLAPHEITRCIVRSIKEWKKGV